MFTELLTGLVGLLGGIIGAGIFVWAVLAPRERKWRDYAITLEADQAAASARIDMLETQLDQRTSECEKLRNALRKYEREWTSAVTRLDETKNSLREQKALVEQAKGTLSQTFQALAA